MRALAACMASQAALALRRPALLTAIVLLVTKTHLYIVNVHK